MILAADLLRMVTIMLMLAVIVLSWVTLRGHIRQARAGGPRALLARHVVKVSASHVGCLVVLVCLTTNRLGRKPQLLLPFTFLFALVTLSSLVDLLRFQHKPWDGVERRAPQ